MGHFFQSVLLSVLGTFDYLNLFGFLKMLIVLGIFIVLGIVISMYKFPYQKKFLAQWKFRIVLNIFIAQGLNRRPIVFAPAVTVLYRYHITLTTFLTLAIGAGPIASVGE